jgi:acetyl esterase/lipase
MSKSGPPAQPMPEALSSEFSYPKTLSLETKPKQSTHRPSYDIDRVEMAALPDRFDTNRVVTLDYYAPHGQGRKPVVVVLPISGGGYDLEKYVSAYFARRGWAAVIVHRRKLSHEPLTGEELDSMLRQSVTDARRVIDWIETRAELDATKVTVFGVSMGGIKASILTPLDARVKAAVFGLAGGDLPYILRHTTEPGIARRRQRILKQYHLKPDELEERYRTGLECDPNTFAPYAPRDKILLVLACCDRVVPFRKGRELREKLGRPETIFLPTGHYTALLGLPYLRHESFKFFRERVYPRPPKTEQYSARPRG